MLDVITAATDHKLTTVAAVKADLGIVGTDQDVRIGGLIDQYSAAIVGWCDRPFALETVRETLFERCASNGLMLSRWPIVAVSAVSIDGSALDPADFIADKVTGILYRRGTTFRGEFWPAGETIVEYQSGYILPGEASRTLPHDVERAAIMLVKGAYFGLGRDPALRSEDVEGVGTSTWFAASGSAIDGMPLEVQGLLAGYRRQVIG
jgi:hypothetical protein